MASEVTCAILGFGAVLAFSGPSVPQPPPEPCRPYHVYDVAFEYEGGGTAQLTYHRPNYCPSR